MKENCEHCKGTGLEPNGWTLEAARKKPQQFNSHRMLLEYGSGHQLINLTPQVVSPANFKGGQEKCHICKGSGKTKEWLNQQANLKATKKLDHFIDLLGNGSKDPVDIPEGQQAIVIQAFFNDSDTMVDYFNSHASLGPQFVLAFTKNKRETQATIRKVLKTIPELNKLTWEWKTETYSMGHGNYLECKDIAGKYPHKAYDGREEVAYWYEISYVSSKYAKPLASKWFNNNNNSKKEKKTMKKNYTIGSKGKGKLEVVKYGEYKGHPTITIPDGSFRGFTFGLAKARAIIKHIDVIEGFVENNS